MNRFVVCGFVVLAACGPEGRKLDQLSAATVVVDAASGAGPLFVRLNGVSSADSCEAVSSKVSVTINGHALEQTGNGEQLHDLLIKRGCAPIVWSTKDLSKLELDKPTSSVLFSDSTGSWNIEVEQLAFDRSLQQRVLPDPFRSGESAFFQLGIPTEASGITSMSSLILFDVYGEGADVPTTLENGEVKLTMPATEVVGPGKMTVAVETGARVPRCEGPANCSAPVTWTTKVPVNVGQ